MSFVVDASLATKWLIDESDSALADRFFASYFREMHAPDLLLVEIGSAIVTAVNSRRISREDATTNLVRLGSLSETAVILHRVTAKMSLNGARLAIDLGHPIKDCIYLVLADELGIPLATSDVKFHDKVGDRARVRLLADLV